MDAENLAPAGIRFPENLQPVASRYTDYAIPTHVLYGVSYMIVTFSKCGLEEQD